MKSFGILSGDQNFSAKIPKKCKPLCHCLSSIVTSRALALFEAKEIALDVSQRTLVTSVTVLSLLYCAAVTRDSYWKTAKAIRMGQRHHQQCYSNYKEDNFGRKPVFVTPKTKLLS